VRSGIAELVAETGADELMIVSDIYDLDARKRSLEIIAESQAGDTGATVLSTAAI
jgi:hypothetical protein